MIKNIYVIRDKSLQCYDIPRFVNEDKQQYCESIVRGLKKATPQDKMNLKDYALYFIGQYDDNTGKFMLVEEEKLLDYEDYLPKVDIDDGKEA